VTIFAAPLEVQLGTRPCLAQVVWVAAENIIVTNVRLVIRVHCRQGVTRAQWWRPKMKTKAHLVGVSTMLAFCIVFFLSCLTLVVGSASSQAIASGPEAPWREYVDQQYQFAFQFPADWKIEKDPPPGEAGEVRVLVGHPTKAIRVMVIVDQVGKSYTKRQFELSPTRDAVVEELIERTIDQVYKKTSRDIGAERMIVAEKRAVPSNAGIKFYIATVNIIKGTGVMGASGIHILPFEKPYMVSFLMSTPADQTATSDNEIIKNVFDSFHILGEPPIK
jgi:hypothetical protein